MITWKGFADTPDQPGEYWHDTIISDLLTRVSEMNLLITPGHFRDATALNEYIAGQSWIVWILGDEEGDCPFWDVHAPVWRQFPNPHRLYWPDRILPLGYTPGTRARAQEWGLPQKDGGWTLAGQDTNVRRHAAFQALGEIDPSRVHPSPTFGGGLDHDSYLKLLWQSDWAPSPAGNVRADSFRMWEALEMGAVPILDATSPAGDRNVWPDTLGDHPMPVITDWSMVADILEAPAPKAETLAWYTRYKHGLIHQLAADWEALGYPPPWDPPRSRITTIITASPIPSDPDFAIIRETVESVRERLPGNEIVIAFDGPRYEDVDYLEQIWRVSWWANQYWPETRIWYTGAWKHQAGTVRDVLATLGDRALLMVEHDTPLKGDIPWDDLVTSIYKGEFDSIRLHYDASIHPAHEYLMRGMVISEGHRITKTVQYSQRPHITTTMFYRGLLGMVPIGARTYIEDCVYGPVANAPWDHHKLGIYTPPGDIARSYHLDGRGGVPKGEFWW